MKAARKKDRKLTTSHLSKPSWISCPVKPPGDSSPTGIRLHPQETPGKTHPAEHSQVTELEDIITHYAKLLTLGLSVKQQQITGMVIDVSHSLKTTIFVSTKSLRSCPALCIPMDRSPPGSSAHGILQARILEWVAMPSSREVSRDQTRLLELLHCRHILYY